MARERPAILAAFARRYRASQQGRTGVSAKDFAVDYRELLRTAGAEDGEARVMAARDLRDAANRARGLLKIETHPRDEDLIHFVRLARDGGEAWLFGDLGETAPALERAELASIFEAAAMNSVPELWKDLWESWCLQMARRAGDGGSVAPFERDDLAAGRELLRVCVRLLNWQGESLVRFASCTICGQSKVLEGLRAKLEACLGQISDGKARSLEDLGLFEKPRRVTVRGPLILEFPEGILDAGILQGSITISETDLFRATAVQCNADQVLTVENETTFFELAKLKPDTLLVLTSYPGRATLALLSRLPAALPVWHFGDTDPAGYDILRDLRERTGRLIQPLHMHYRPLHGSDPLTAEDRRMVERLLANSMMADCHGCLRAMIEAASRGKYEQETLGRPTLNAWPFYA